MNCPVCKRPEPGCECIPGYEDKPMTLTELVEELRLHVDGDARSTRFYAQSAALLLSQSREIERLREAREESALDVATRLARQVFQKRGDHSEIHVTEGMLAAMLALAIERSAQGD